MACPNCRNFSYAVTSDGRYQCTGGSYRPQNVVPPGAAGNATGAGIPIGPTVWVPCGLVYEPSEGRLIDQSIKWRQERDERIQKDEAAAVARIRRVPDPITRLLRAVAVFIELEWHTNSDGYSQYLPTGDRQIVAAGLIRDIYPNWPTTPPDEAVALSFAQAAKQIDLAPDATCRWPEPATRLLGGWQTEKGRRVKTKLGSRTAAWQIPNDRISGSWRGFREPGLIAEDGRLYLGWQKIYSDKKRIARVGELGLPALKYLGMRLEESDSGG
jgi:hypothetical protein